MHKRTGLIIISTLALLLFGVCVFSLRDLIFGGVAATYETASENQYEYADKWITYEVIACLGEYAEYTETEYFIPTKHAYYYMCWMEDGALMPLSVSSKKDREYLDAMTDATYDYIEGKTDSIEMEPKVFTGVVKTQEREALNYYNGMLEEMNATEKDGFKVKYVLLDCSESRSHYIFLASAVMCIPILGFVVSFVGFRKDKKKQENEADTYLPR